MCTVLAGSVTYAYGAHHGGLIGMSFQTSKASFKGRPLLTRFKGDHSGRIVCPGDVRPFVCN